MLTLLTVVFFAGLTLCCFASWIAALRWGARWVGSGRASYARAAAVLAATLVASAIGLLLSHIVAADMADTINLVFSLLQLVIACFLIARLFELKWHKAILAWLPTLAALGIWLLVVQFVVRPYFFAGFTVPTNAMAPTILGTHLTAPCPHCGSPAYGSPATEGFEPRKLLMICGSELKTYEMDQPSSHIGESDRFIVNKMVVPKRWDLIVFRYPEDPSIMYVKRLVGLPREEVVIRDGAVWIDGRRLEVPKEIAGLEYLNELKPPIPLSGTPENPAPLGEDEYFVLGDFSANSSDSRVWSHGSPGHPSYAVPASHLDGVVTQIYWPIDRWRAFR